MIEECKSSRSSTLFTMKGRKYKYGFLCSAVRCWIRNIKALYTESASSGLRGCVQLRLTQTERPANCHQTLIKMLQEFVGFTYVFVPLEAWVILLAAAAVENRCWLLFKFHSVGLWEKVWENQISFPVFVFSVNDFIFLLWGLMHK